MAEKGKGSTDDCLLRKPNNDTDNTFGNRKRKTISDFEVQENGSNDDFEINMITATGNVIPVKVKGSDTIDKIKLKIQAQGLGHVPVDHLELFFKEKVIENDNALSNLPIKKESALTLTRKSMNIFIKNLEGKNIFSLEVKPSDTIGNVKAKMSGFSGFRHVLIFGGVVLEDSGTLADFNIINGSTLIQIGKSEGNMEIFVKTFTGKTISFLVTPSDTIANVKLEIMYEERIPIEDQVLIFDGMALGDIGTLCDYNIKGQSTLTLMRRSRGLMHIFIKTSKGDIVTVEVNPSHTIGNVKSKIHDKIHIPHDEQELIFNGIVLDNTDTLADSNINKESTLMLVRISTGCMQIFIKTQAGKTIAMKVKPSDTIYNVKSKIGNMEGVPRCQVRLLFDGKRLDDRATLADYHISKQSTVDSYLRFRGD